MSPNAKGLPAWLDTSLYPFDQHSISVDGGRMNYVDVGDGDPIVMVHGNPGWSFEYRNVIQEMSKSKRCIAPDMIGFGLSDHPEGWSYLPEAHAKNFGQLMDTLDLQNITLVVNDWGGPIGLSYVLKHPDRFRKVVICNSWMWSVKGDKHFERFSGFMGGGLGKFLILNFNFFGKAVVKKAFGDKKKLTKNIHRHYFKHMPTKSSRMGSHVFPREIIGSSEWLASLWEQRESMKHLEAALVWGEKDIAFRENELQTWLELFPNALVTRLPNTGHFPQDEDPEAVIRSIRE